jgi:hypothetical protein
MYKKIGLIMKNTILIHTVTACFISLVILNISGCSLFSNDSDIKPEFEMSVEGYEVAPGESFVITLSVKNPSDNTISFNTSCQEFAGLFTYKSNELVDFSGNNTGCARMINTYELKPRESLSFKWDLVASIVEWNSETSSTDTTYAAPGEYLFQVRLNTESVNGKELVKNQFEKSILIK